MVDLPDKTDDVTLWNEGRTKAVTVTTDGAKERLDVDALTQNYEQAAIQGGTAFTHNMVHILGNNETFYHLLITPNTTTRIHFRYRIQSTNALDVYFYEAGTTTANGSAGSLKNRERNSATDPVLTLFHAPTVAVDGTELEHFAIGSNGNGGNGGSIATEIILKQNTKYLFKYISHDAANNISEEMFWTEVTP